MDVGQTTSTYPRYFLVFFLWLLPSFLSWWFQCIDLIGFVIRLGTRFPTCSASWIQNFYRTRWYMYTWKNERSHGCAECIVLWSRTSVSSLTLPRKKKGTVACVPQVYWKRIHKMKLLRYFDNLLVNHIYIYLLLSWVFLFKVIAFCLFKLEIYT